MQSEKQPNNKVQKPIFAMLMLFVLCCIFHYAEVLFIRTDETFFADNFINKVVGIVLLAIAIKRFHISWADIGFRFAKRKYLGYGLAVGVLCFTVAYAVEYIILYVQNLAPKLEWYISGFSLTGDVVKQTGLFAFFLCILFNIVNVVMEEGIFRGLFIRLGAQKLRFWHANWLAALLFGLWHLSLPIRSTLDGQMTVLEALLMGIGYVILAALMGIKWGVWLRNTNCLWFGIAEHFFNNTIGNVLHVSSVAGHDSMQIIRVLIAQVLSLAITFAINKHATQSK